LHSSSRRFATDLWGFVRDGLVEPLRHGLDRARAHAVDRDFDEFEIYIQNCMSDFEAALYTSLDAAAAPDDVLLDYVDDRSRSAVTRYVHFRQSLVGRMCSDGIGGRLREVWYQTQHSNMRPYTDIELGIEQLHRLVKEIAPGGYGNWDGVS
jgi:hypothetical protein